MVVLPKFEQTKKGGALTVHKRGIVSGLISRAGRCRTLPTYWTYRIIEYPTHPNPKKNQRAIVTMYM
jgi:hypothetical protein